MRLGLEVLLGERLEALSGRRVGLIANPTSVLPDFTHAVDALAGSAVDLAAIFAPEHGFRGEAQAGDSGAGYTDPRTGVPVYDIYGQEREEIRATFERAGVDTVLFDIQDAGARFYTYIWTLSDTLEAAALDGLEYVVLDRPNPITGLAAEGPVLDSEHATFVGRYEVPQRHGMTVGELAGMFNEAFVPERTGGERAELSVVPMSGWRRGMFMEETGQPWVMPSPNMPSVETAVVYPGTGMFEGTNLSEGRGTTRPFELLGAPYIDGQLAESLNAAGPPGAAFREAYFAPTFSKFEGETVGGIQLYVTDRASFDPIGTALAIILATRDLYGGEVEWRNDDYDPETPYWIDKLTGSDSVRNAVDAGSGVAEISSGWQAELEDFRRLREQYLLYGG